MSIQIRRAAVDDAPAIAAISRLSFGTAINESRIRHLLLLNRNITWVAVLSGGAAGFADYFLTVSRDDEVRLELDLLAVHPQARGMAAGQRLVGVGIEQAKRLGAASVRALVAADNHAMQRLCAALGFRRSKESYALFVISPHPASPHKNNAAAVLIPVETLIYSGIWIEGGFSQAAIDNALFVAHSRRLATVGAVASNEDAAAQSLFRANGFDCLGAFDWWTINL